MPQAAPPTQHRFGVRRIAVLLVPHAMLVAAVAVGLVVLTARPAVAHASFVAASPGPGSDLAAAPGVVTLRFSEPLIEELSSVTVTAPDGRTFTGGPSDDREMEVDLDSTAQGAYTVDWKTVSPIDGHTLRGSFRFGVGAAVGHQDPPSEAPTATDLLIGIARTIEYVGLLGALGLLSLAALASPTGPDWAPTGLQWWIVVAAVGGVLAVTGEMLLASSGVGPAARAFLTAPSGWPRVGRVATELAAAGITLGAARRSAEPGVPQRRARVTATLLVLASLALLAAGGHAAASGGYGIAADAGHLMAAGVWAGALLVMAVQRPPGGWRSDIGWTLIREFSPIALTMFAVTVLLGSVRAWQELAHPADLWTTDYGQVLSVKIGLVAAMVPLSVLAWRHRRAHPRSEGLLAIGAVLAAGLLAAFPVPPGRAGEEEPAEADAADVGLPQPGDLTLGEAAGTTVVGMSIRPAEPGINDVYAHLVPISGSEDAGPLTTEIAVDGSSPAPMRRCGPACRIATLPVEGGETVEISVSGEGGGTATFELPSLPAPDGQELAERLTIRMKELDSYRYDEVLGPADPPLTSTWEIVAPDRINGVMTGGADFRETIRIEDRSWHRDRPDGPWEGGEPGQPVINVNRFIWDYPGKTAARIVGGATVDGVDTRIVSFFVDVGAEGQLPIWYRLWVDDDARVRRAEMRAQGHFMHHRYYDFDAPIAIEPPT